MGLDDIAVGTVRRYRLRPALQDGIPVPVRIHIEVRFRIN